MYQQRGFPGGRLFTNHNLSSDDCEPRPPPKLISAPHPYDMVKPVPVVPEVTLLENSGSSVGFLSNCGEHTLQSPFNGSSSSHNNTITPKFNRVSSVPNSSANTKGCCEMRRSSGEGYCHPPPPCKGSEKIDQLQELVLRQGEALGRMEAHIKRLIDFQESFLSKSEHFKPLTYDRDVQTDGNFSPIEISRSSKRSQRRYSLEVEPTVEKKSLEPSKKKSGLRAGGEEGKENRGRKVVMSPLSIPTTPSSSDKTVYGMSSNFLSFATKKYLQRYGLVDGLGGGGGREMDERGHLEDKSESDRSSSSSSSASSERHAIAQNGKKNVQVRDQACGGGQEEEEEEGNNLILDITALRRQPKLL